MLKTIYALVDPRSGEVRYVGATVNPKRRLIDHYNTRNKMTTKCSAWVRELDSEGLKPMMRGLMRASDWEKAERFVIDIFRRNGRQLLNHADGGLGVPGCKPSKETVKKRADVLRGLYAKDPDRMAKRRQIALAAAHSEQARKAASNRMHAIWADPDRAAAMRACMKGSKARAKERQA